MACLPESTGDGRRSKTNPAAAAPKSSGTTLHNDNGPGRRAGAQGAHRQGARAGHKAHVSFLLRPGYRPGRQAGLGQDQDAHLLVLAVPGGADESAAAGRQLHRQR